MKSIFWCIVFAMLFVHAAPAAFGHCEIPCGIYGDRMRITMIAEHITTIEKSMKMIDRLSKEKEQNYNQLVRWVTNKEKHANEIQKIVTQYFMTQRIKPVKEGSEGYKIYVEQVTLLHKMLVYSMKTKQAVDPVNAMKLRKLLEQFEKAYFGAKPQVK